MSKSEDIPVTIEYYGEEKLVCLPTDYNTFIQSISSMLQISKEKIGDFQFSYQNNSDLKIYFVKNAEDYDQLLKACKEKKTKMINIESIKMFEEKQDEKEKNIIKNIDNKNEIKEINANKNNKVSFFEEEKQIEENNNIINIKLNNDSGMIHNKIDDNLEAMEFSYLDANNIDNSINNKKDNINNKEINCQINIPTLNKNFRLDCDICKRNKLSETIYCCSDCKIFFCDNCEVDFGRIHKHCYYKIRNQKQYSEIKDSLNSFGNKFETLNNNMNKSIINNGKTIENSVKEIISEGSKIFGNIGNTIKSFFNPNENNDNNINNNQNNDINSNELVNPYTLKNNNNNQKINIGNIPDEKQLKLLVMKAKTTYNLSQFNDIDIERALVQNKGNIDEAVSMLFSNNDL